MSRQRSVRKYLTSAGQLRDRPVDQVIAVDNGSDRETASELQKLELHNGLKVVYNVRNLGVAGVLNQGVKCAIERGHRWVLTIGHDSEATPRMVEELRRAYDGVARARGLSRLTHSTETGDFSS